MIEPEAQVSIAEAKATFSSLVSAVAGKGNIVTILKRGVPVAQLIAFPEQKRSRLRDSMAGTVQELGDIVGTSGEEWILEND